MRKTVRLDISLSMCTNNYKDNFPLCSCRCKTRSCSLKLPEDVAHFMDGNHGNLNHGILTREVTEDDIDVPMLSMEQRAQYLGML